MVKRLLTIIIFGAIFLVACSTATNSASEISSNEMTSNSPSTSSVSKMPESRNINTYQSNGYGIDFAKYNGWWEDPEFIEDDQKSNTIELNFDPKNNTGGLYIIVYGQGDRLFSASASIALDKNGVGEFLYEDEICGLKGNGKISLHEEDIKMSLNIITEDEELAQIYSSEKTFIRNSNEGKTLPDPFELLSESTGYTEGNGIEFVLNASESEGFKSWISIISINKDGNEIETYKVNTQRLTIEEYDLE